VPIDGIKQPDVLTISPELRLRRYTEPCDFALPWYQDRETLDLVDGKNAPEYDMARLGKMFQYLRDHGELYFIEVLEDGDFIPIGGVAFWQDDMPIVIGSKPHRNLGIGKQIVAALVNRARELGFCSIGVSEIFRYNKASQRLFENAGFNRIKETECGYAYALTL
jgi:RimJ/RimL family protein N-acetyltransferase